MKTWKTVLLAVFFSANAVLFSGAAEAAKLGDRVLNIGMSGQDVVQLQSKLAAIGFDPGPIDGHFGKMTKTAIMLLEQAKQMSVDGVAGPKVLQLLNEAQNNSVSRGNEVPTRYKKMLEMESTAYAPNSSGNGDITYSGTLLRKGVVAVDPRVIPLGTRMYVQGYGYAVAEDIGGAIKGNKIDIALMSVDAAYQWGRRDVNVYILE
jgi:3D (Asp-Asp-Asp) domain-containing protein